MGLFRTHPTIQPIDYATTSLQILNYWVVASRDNFMVRVSNNLIESSSDSGETWVNSIEFLQADKILHGYIYPNNNVCFFTIDNKIYKTSIDLNTIEEKTLYQSDRVTPYVFHTPANASFPGAYFEIEDHMSFTLDNVHIIANYCNSPAINGGRGASAVIVPMSDDNGESWVVTYEFGQNLVYRDNGTAAGASTGTLLGDAGNTNVSRHVHSIEYNPFNDKYYMNTGDTYWTFTTPDMDEIGWYEGTYNAGTRLIDWVKIDFGRIIERTDNLKATGMYFTATHIYWGSDANPVTVPDNQGIFRAPMATFNNIDTHEVVLQLDTDDVILCMKMDNNTNNVLAILLNEANDKIDRLLAVKDYGHGAFSIYQFLEPITLLRLNSPNKNGFFRMDFNGFNTLQTKSVLVKVGSDLFNNI